MNDRATPIVIGIAGGTGSGKTTIANIILKRVGKDLIAFLPHDAYYKDLSHLTSVERSAINYDHPDSLETSLLIDHIKLLITHQAIDLPIYDFKTHVRTKFTNLIHPKRIILVEGILIFVDDALCDLFDVKIFVDTDADIRFIRRLKRDISERGRTMNTVIGQYQKTVRKSHLDFVEPSKRNADIIIPEGGQNIVALDMVVARIQALLHGERVKR